MGLPRIRSRLHSAFRIPILLERVGERGRNTEPDTAVVDTVSA